MTSAIPLSSNPYTRNSATAVKVVLGAVSLAVAAVLGATWLPPDPVEIKYTAPATVEAGLLAVIDVSETGADSYAYSVHPPVPCRVFEDGTKLVFSTPTGGDYVFVVAAAKGGQIGLAEITITVDGETPGPPAPETFGKRLTAAVSRVTSAAKATEQAALANTFDTVASMVAAGIIKDPDALETAIVNLNKEAGVFGLSAWAPVSALVKAELDARQFATVQEYAGFCREVASLLKGA